MSNVFHFKPFNCIRKAFTLAELEISLGVSVLISGMSLLVLLAVLRLYVVSDIKTSVSEEYRRMKRVMVDQGCMSNGFYIYPSFNAADRKLSSNQVPVGGAGDFVVFVFFSLKDIKEDPNYQRVSRIMGFFRENPGDVKTPVRWFDSEVHNWGQSFSASNPAQVPIPNSGENFAIEALLPPESFRLNCPVLANYSMGAIDDTMGAGRSMFYNMTKTNNSPAFLVSGFVLRSTSSAGSAVLGYESQTAFNLTIVPRSN